MGTKIVQHIRGFLKRYALYKFTFYLLTYFLLLKVGAVAFCHPSFAAVWYKMCREVCEAKSGDQNGTAH